MTTTPGHMDLISMFLLGFLGTGHCIGMCGPLVVALPGQLGGWAAHLTYHLGRIVTYSLVGGIMAMAGSGLILLDRHQVVSPISLLARTQVGISLVAAIFLFLFGLVRLGLLKEPRWLAVANPQKIPGYSSTLRIALTKKAYPWAMVMGLMMGLLPCGLSYAAFARALAAGSCLDGIKMASVFGLGTLPGLLAVGSGAAPFFRRYRHKTELLSGLIMVGMAAKLVADAFIH